MLILNGMLDLLNDGDWCGQGILVFSWRMGKIRSLISFGKSSVVHQHPSAFNYLPLFII